MQYRFSHTFEHKSTRPTKHYNLDALRNQLARHLGHATAQLGEITYWRPRQATPQRPLKGAQLHYRTADGRRGHLTVLVQHARTLPELITEQNRLAGLMMDLVRRHQRAPFAPPANSGLTLMYEPEIDYSLTDTLRGQPEPTDWWTGERLERSKTVFPDRWPEDDQDTYLVAIRHPKQLRRKYRLIRVKADSATAAIAAVKSSSEADRYRDWARFTAGLLRSGTDLGPLYWWRVNATLDNTVMWDRPQRARSGLDAVRQLRTELEGYRNLRLRHLQFDAVLIEEPGEEEESENLAKEAYAPSPAWEEREPDYGYTAHRADRFDYSCFGADAAAGGAPPSHARRQPPKPAPPLVGQPIPRHRPGLGRPGRPRPLPAAGRRLHPNQRSSPRRGGALRAPRPRPRRQPVAASKRARRSHPMTATENANPIRRAELIVSAQTKIEAMKLATRQMPLQRSLEQLIPIDVKRQVKQAQGYYLWSVTVQIEPQCDPNPPELGARAAYRPAEARTAPAAAPTGDSPTDPAEDRLAALEARFAALLNQQPAAAAD